MYLTQPLDLEVGVDCDYSTTEEGVRLFTLSIGRLSLLIYIRFPSIIQDQSRLSVNSTVLRPFCFKKSKFFFTWLSDVCGSSMSMILTDYSSNFIGVILRSCNARVNFVYFFHK